MIIHLGDIIRDAEDLQILYPHLPVEYVCGNNDFNRTVPYEKILDVKERKILITHGHLYRVKYEYDTIVDRGLALNVDAVLFGHTHEPYEEHRSGISVMNPGSTSIPKFGRPSYGVIEIDNGKIATCICGISS